MIYLDTCVLAPLFIPEATSEALEQWLMTLPADELSISDWTSLEFYSLIARCVRMQQIDRPWAGRILAEFQRVSKAHFYPVRPGALDYDLACHYVEQFATGLRGGDALHLAIAVNRNAQQIFSLDQGLIEAGKYLGLPVQHPLQSCA